MHIQQVILLLVVSQSILLLMCTNLSPPPRFSRVLVNGIASKLELSLTSSITVSQLPAVLCFRQGQVIAKMQGAQALGEHFHLQRCGAGLEAGGSSPDLRQWIDKVSSAVSK